MGLALGGIAAPVPRKVYGWVGAQAVAQGTTETITLATGGFAPTSFLKIIGQVTLNTGVSGATSVYIYVNDGADHEIANYSTSGIGSRGCSITAFFANGYQSAIDDRGSLVNSTHAIAPENIVSIKITVTAAADAGNNGVIRGLSVTQLDVP